VQPSQHKWLLHSQLGFTVASEVWRVYRQVHHWRAPYGLERDDLGGAGLTA
jgi:hypothetical protein